MAKQLKLIAVVLMAVMLPAILICLSNTGRSDYGSMPAMAETDSPVPGLEATPASTPQLEKTTDPNALNISAENYKKGLEYLIGQEYEKAQVYFSGVIPEDSEHYIMAQDKLNACSDAIKSAVLASAQASFGKSHYKECLNLIESSRLTVPDDPELASLSKKAQEALENPVLYDGPIYHIFFHSLIVYPELCFTGDSMSSGYNKWMTTVSEFKAMLKQLYDRNYVLVDIEDLFGTDETGRMVKKDIYLPKGEKPLILSVDNVSYEDYRVNDGFASKLVLDANGDVASLVKTPQGNGIITRGGDVMPILDDFVKSNPDFSLNNAKGIIALNGYAGVLGYRTNRTNHDWESEKAEAAKVVERLKSTGWKFANHSYSHSRIFSNYSITLDQLKSDTDKWQKEVADITGPTPIYITPFGIEFRPGDPRVGYLVSQGYNIFCDVGCRARYDLFKDHVWMERIDLDGYKMNFSRKALEPLIDIDLVYDTRRPPMDK